MAKRPVNTHTKNSLSNVVIRIRIRMIIMMIIMVIIAISVILDIVATNIVLMLLTHTVNINNTHNINSYGPVKTLRPGSVKRPKLPRFPAMPGLPRKFATSQWVSGSGLIRVSENQGHPSRDLYKTSIQDPLFSVPLSRSHVEMSTV